MNQAILHWVQRPQFNWRSHPSVNTAYLDEPFDHHLPDKLVWLTTRTADNLPAHIKGTVQWRCEGQHEGYYLWHPNKERFIPVEFVQNHWHLLCVYVGQPFTSLARRIEPHTRGTRYWDITKTQHPNYLAHLNTLAQQAAEIERQLAQQRAEEAARQEQIEAATWQVAPPVLAVNTTFAPLTGEPSISPFIAARPSPAEEEDSSSGTPLAHTPEEQDPSPEQINQEEPVLQAQL